MALVLTNHNKHINDFPITNHMRKPMKKLASGTKATKAKQKNTKPFSSRILRAKLEMRKREYYTRLRQQYNLPIDFSNYKITINRPEPIWHRASGAKERYAKARIALAAKSAGKYGY